MQIVGYVFLALIAVGVVIGLVMGAASLPDIARYFRIRKM
jgi:Sec-independent protein translocase protein TatA